MLWRMASLGIVPPSWMPSMPVWASRREWRSLRRRAAGSRLPGPRTRWTGRREHGARSAWWSDQTKRHARWRPWQPACPPPVGIGGKARKGRRVLSRMSVPASVSRSRRQAFPREPSGS
jgi:hypothetical protein